MAKGGFSTVQNLGEPLNSGDDDLGIDLTSDNGEVFFSGGCSGKFYRDNVALPMLQK